MKQVDEAHFNKFIASQPRLRTEPRIFDEGFYTPWFVLSYYRTGSDGPVASIRTIWTRDNCNTTTTYWIKP